MFASKNDPERQNTLRESEISAAIDSIKKFAQSDNSVTWVGGGGSFFDSSNPTPGDIDLAISFNNVSGLNAEVRQKQYFELETLLRKTGIGLDLHLGIIDAEISIQGYFNNEIVAVGFINIYGVRPKYLIRENYPGMES